MDRRMATEYKSVKKKFLLAKDEVWHTAWHYAAFFGKLEGLKSLWSLAKKVELKLLLAGTEQRQTVCTGQHKTII